MPAMKGDAFVCACLNANDPLKDMRMVLDDCLRMGVYSVSNIGPSISYVDKGSEIRKVLTSAGITLQNEIDLLKLGREMDMVTIGLAFDEEDSIRLVERSAARHLLLPRRHHQGRPARLRLGRDDRGDGASAPRRPTRSCARSSRTSSSWRTAPRWSHRPTPSTSSITRAAKASGPARRPSACRSSVPSRPRRGSSRRCASPTTGNGAHDAEEGHCRPRDARHEGAGGRVPPRATRGAGQPRAAGGHRGDEHAGDSRRRHARPGRTRRRHGARRPAGGQVARGLAAGDVGRGHEAAAAAHRTRARSTA